MGKPKGLDWCDEMDIESGFTQVVHGEVEIHNDIVIGNQVDTESVTKKELINQGVILLYLRHRITDIAAINEEIEVQAERNYAEFGGFDK